VLPRRAIALIALGWLPLVVGGDWLGAWDPPPLSTAQQVCELSLADANSGRAVKLTGVVTFAGSRADGLYVQNAAAGVFVRATTHAAGLRPGDRVEIAGTTYFGEFAPCIEATGIRRLGFDDLPESLPFNLSIEDSRWLHGRRVHARVLVQSARSEVGSTYIDVATTHGLAVVKIAGEEWTLAARALRDQVISVQGVCVATTRDRRVSDPATILVDQFPARAPAEASGGPNSPPLAISRLLEFAPGPDHGARQFTISGVVTATPLHNLLIVQEPSGGVAVWTDEPTRIPVGARVEAFGLARADNTRLSLEHARVKGLGNTPLPPATPAHADEIARGEHHDRLVRIIGHTEGLHEVDGWTSIALREGGVRLEAYVPGTLEQNGLGKKVEIGSKVSLIGVPAGVGPDRTPPTTPGLFLPAEDAIHVLERPQLPPLPDGPSMVPNSTTRTAYMIGGAAAAFLLAGGWVLALRGQARRQTEEKTKLERQLRQASKLEAVGRLAGGIAHDFNNLLTVINGCAELLAEETAADGGRLSALTDDIRKAGERAASLTGQLLTFSRKRDIAIAAVNINDVVADTRRLLDRVIGEQIRIESVLASSLPPVRGEAGLLHQVIMNLAVNAKDAMPDGGVLTFTTGLLAEGGRPESRARLFVRLSVSDTGVGMSDEVKGRLFEPFFTTKAVGNGTGLGLATVSGIVSLLGGRINVETKLGAGTHFHIDLRVYGEPVSDAEFSLPSDPTPFPAPRTASAQKLAGVRVLVVEDNEMVRSTVVAGLRGEGAIVHSAACPDEALLLLATHGETIEVLVTDVVMPGMSGPALARCICQSRPEICVVYMSGYNAEEVSRLGLREEQVEFLQKPFTPDNLIRRLLRVLPRRSSPASPE